MSSAAPPSLTTGAVARRLGVSPTTLRSWERRYGIGPAERPEGRHRRWTPRDVALLDEMCRLTSLGVPPAEAARAALSAAPGTPIAPPPAPPSPPAPPAQPGGRGALPVGSVRQECRGLARAAVRLDSPAMERLLADCLDAHGLLAAWDEVIMPTLHAVGRKWATEGERYVEVEHLLSWHVTSALRRHSDAAPDAPHTAPALLCGVPGEQHVLALEALAAGLSERGLPVRMFGAALPAPALGEAVRRLGPGAVVLWCQLRSTADHALAHDVARLRWGGRGARRRPAVLLAGPGWSGSAPPPGCVRLTNLAAALDTIAGLLAGRDLPEAGTPGADRA
ncbi:MerR family transcriptional regulator [Streptomyces sp. NPDC001941]|uniref:MerR family transcriptional regulator n=1 Tax=Streptomyces sp. NPDC001941 TaxID=3154659 RepID=UPI00332C0DCB